MISSRYLALLSLLLVMLLVGQNGVFAQKTVTVEIAAGSGLPGCEAENKCFEPFEVTVPAGTTVTWVNKDSQGHTVTSGKPGEAEFGTVFDSGFPLLKPEATFEHTFDKAGEYPYFCQVHPYMIGRVIVTESMEEEFKPMMETLTNAGSVKVQVAWTPETIEPEVPVEFKLRLLDPTNDEPIKDAIFDFMLIHEGSHITHRSLQQATDGSSTQTFTFKPTQTGAVLLRLENVNNTGEAVDFPINVVPEFPAGLLAFLMAIMFVSAMLVARKHRPSIKSY